MFIGIQFGNTNTTCSVKHGDNCIVEKLSHTDGENFSLDSVNWVDLFNFIKTQKSDVEIKAIAYTVPKLSKLSDKLFGEIEDTISKKLEELGNNIPKFIFVPKYIAAYIYIKKETDNPNLTICHFGGQTSSGK